MKKNSGLFIKISILIIVLLLSVVIFYVGKMRDFWQTINTTVGSMGGLRNATQEKNIFNILLLGYAGSQLQGGYLTDSMILAHLNFEDNIVFLISIPRDLWVQIPVQKDKPVYKKINTAYSIGLSDKTYSKKEKIFKGELGAGNMAKYVVEQVLGLPVDYYAAVDFKGFVDVVDAIGGVQVNLDKTLDDREYPREGYEEDTCGLQEQDLIDLDQKLATISALEYFPCRYEHLVIPAGKNNLDGETALKLVRSRHGLYDGTDFGRADRQQKLLVAVKDKVLSLGFIAKVPSLMDSLKDKIRTDIPYDFITKLLSEKIKFDNYQVRHLVISDQNFLESSFSADRQYILVPKDDDWTVLQDWIDTIVKVKRSQYPKIILKNMAGIEGLARTAGDRLSAYGLMVDSIVTATETGKLETEIFIKKGSVDEFILDRLEDEFTAVIDDSLAGQAEQSLIEINIGKNYQKKLK